MVMGTDGREHLSDATETCRPDSARGSWAVTMDVSLRVAFTAQPPAHIPPACAVNVQEGWIGEEGR